MSPPLPTQSGESPARPRGYDLGLLLLRGAAALVLVTWGWGKFTALMHALNSGPPLGSWHFVQIIGQVGFPFPTFMAVCAVLNESLVATLLVLGIFMRPAALIAALGMIGALYASICWNNELLRAALCALIFAALALLGAGRYSLGHVLWPGREDPTQTSADLGLVLLRTGAAVASVSLAIIPLVKAPNLAVASPANWWLIVAGVGSVLAALGLKIRPVSAALTGFWLFTSLAGLYAGFAWSVFPIRAALFAIIYGALALTGPGRRSASPAQS